MYIIVRLSFTSSQKRLKENLIMKTQRGCFTIEFFPNIFLLLILFLLSKLLFDFFQHFMCNILWILNSKFTAKDEGNQWGKSWKKREIYSWRSNFCNLLCRLSVTQILPHLNRNQSSRSRFRTRGGKFVEGNSWQQFSE